MEHFTPLSALFGGLLIGSSAALLMMMNGRIAGICGIARLSPRSIMASLVFMTTAVAAIFVTRHVIGV